jgi:Cu-Zn family superoxide dismutase
MKRAILTILLMCGITAPVAAQARDQASILTRYADKASHMAEGTIINNDGKTIGHIALWQGTEGVVMHIEAENLPRGRHGMHFHAVGDCSDHAKFKSAGGHVMAESRPHGYFHDDGPHDGNLPNLVVGKDGSVNVELYSGMVTLNGYTAPLLDDDGSALIVHINPDDHHSQPIGGSGARIACAEIKPATLE